MNPRAAWILVGTALAALAAWPAFMFARASATAISPEPAWTAAPVIADYLQRDALVTAYEADVRRNPDDQIIAHMLAAQYLQRYRERADVGDLLRAQAQARRSLALQPRDNINADRDMAAVLTAFHQMRQALGYAREASAIMPSSFEARATIANLDMELGLYSAAKSELAMRPPDDDAVWDIALARYDELTGRLSSARGLVDAVQRQTDELVDDPAESRAWTHWRQGELAFAAGDVPAATAHYREALAIFPEYWHAYNGLAKAYWAQGDWVRARDAAAKGASLYPLPETLGYEYDARRALGDRDGAAQTLDLILAIERIGNTQGMNDRLIAMFYADHDMRAADAIEIARRDLTRRDDIYAEDTLAWALAAAGHWQEARLHAHRATRLGTEDARLQYHAGIIAVHCGDTREAAARLRFALSINAHFNPFQASEARRILGDARQQRF